MLMTHVSSDVSVCSDGIVSSDVNVCSDGSDASVCSEANDFSDASVPSDTSVYNDVIVSYDASVSSDMIHGSVSSNASDTGMIAVFSPSSRCDHLRLKSAPSPRSVDEGSQMHFYLSFAKIKNNTPVNCGIL